MINLISLETTGCGLSWVSYTNLSYVWTVTDSRMRNKRMALSWQLLPRSKQLGTGKSQTSVLSKQLGTKKNCLWLRKTWTWKNRKSVLERCQSFWLGRLFKNHFTSHSSFPPSSQLFWTLVSLGFQSSKLFWMRQGNVWEGRWWLGVFIDLHASIVLGTHKGCTFTF
jgi:hypothetical protein